MRVPFNRGNISDIKFGKKVYNGISKLNQISLITNLLARDLSLIPIVNKKDTNVKLSFHSCLDDLNSVKIAFNLSQSVKNKHRSRMFDWMI